MSFGWNNLAANQAVSFTDAQGSGIPLKAGQNHVTSEQLMTKADILAKYQVDAGYLTSYADNQLVPKGAWNGTYRPTGWRPIAPYCVQGTDFEEGEDRWYSDGMSITLKRTNCGTGTYPTEGTYTLANGAYSSFISKADANSKAASDLNTYGQTRINGGTGGNGFLTSEAVCAVGPVLDNQIFIKDVNKNTDIFGVKTYYQIVYGSMFPVKSDILITAEVQTISETKIVKFYLRAGKNHDYVYGGGGIFQRIGKDVKARIIGISIYSDEHYRYFYKPNWI